MINGFKYRHKKNLYGVSAEFRFMDGKLYRLTNNPTDLPKDFAHITDIDEHDWYIPDKWDYLADKLGLVEGPIPNQWFDKDYNQYKLTREGFELQSRWFESMEKIKQKMWDNVGIPAKLFKK